MHRRAFAPALAALVPLLAGPAVAGTDTATFTVSARVQNACTVVGGSLDFGTYDAGQAEDLDGVGTIRLENCTGTVTIELDGGSSGDVQNRLMRQSGGSATLRYQLYIDGARTRVWGTGSAASQVMVLVDSLPVEVYGRIPGGQRVPPGAYTDTVNVTVNF